MNVSSSSRLRAAGIALVALTAACETMAPEFSDPGALTAELQQVNATFDTPAFTSFSGLAEFMGPPAAPAVGALLRSTSPEYLVDPSKPNQRSVAAAEGLRAMVGTFSRPQTGPIIPDALYGNAYEWDVTTDAYVESTTRTGPTSGVRFFIYALDPITDLPAEPLNEVGYVDLIDESVAPALTLHILVKNAAGTVTYVDYTVTVTGSTGSFAASAAGHVANGATGAAQRRLDFTVSFAASGTETAADLSADATFDLANSSVGFELHDDAHLEQSVWTFSRDFRFHRPGEVVTVVGSLTITQTAPDAFTIEGSVTIRINGEGFVTLTFADGVLQTSRELTEQEQLVVIALLEALDDVWDAIEDFFDPAEHFAA
ncbi:MAG TPA: hypothetical protein VGA20_11070 [Gemmatimonadales bacterium]